MKAELVPVKGGSPITITRDLTLIGRQEDLCDVCIDRNSISKIHCVIARTDGLLFIRDLGSTNGTKVNGQKVIRGALLPGDELAIASERFRVSLGPAEPQTNDARTEVIPVMTIPPNERVVPAAAVPLVFDNDDDSESDVRVLDD